MIFRVMATKFCSTHFLLIFGRVCLFPSPLTHTKFEYTILFLAHTEFVNEYKAYTIFFWQYERIKIKNHEVVNVCVCAVMRKRTGLK